MTATLVDRPSQVLHRPKDIASYVVVDTETSGLYVDNGDRMCAVSVAYRTVAEPDKITAWAFPFDQGRAAEKGFHPKRYKDGRLKADVDLAEWDADVNLPRSEWEYLCEWLVKVGRKKGLGAQNGKFDWHMVRAGRRARPDVPEDADPWPGPDLEEYQTWDTQLVNRILWPLESTSLKPTGARLWGAEAVEDAAVLKQFLELGKKLYGLKVEDGPRYDLIPWRVNGPYAASDGVLTLRLTEVQVSMLEEGLGSWNAAHRDIDLGRVLYRMERRGFGPYDVETSRRIARSIEERIAVLEPIFPFQPPTLPAATSYYYDELGLAPWKPGEDRRGWEVKQPRQRAIIVPGPKTEEAKALVAARFPKATSITFKQGSLSADIADRLAASGAPYASEFAEMQRLRIANQMFYDNYVRLAGSDGRLRTTFRQAYVKSGRMSVERFQAQALPKKLQLKLMGEPVREPRSLFGVPEGRRRMNLDLSQAELRIASELAQCRQMADPLRNGEDLHGQTCTRIFGQTPESEDWKKYRDVAKRLNFGGIFMIGAASFQANLWTQGGIEWPLSECKVATDGFKRTYPEIVSSYEQWQSFAMDKGYVVLANGERSWMGRYDYPNTAWNRVVQGSLAAWVANWLIVVENITCDYEALVLTVHDSAVLDLPEDRADEIAAVVKEESEKLWLREFGFPGRVDVEEWS